MPDSSQSQGEESRHVGAVETTESPIPEPKASSVNETPAARIAPAMIARQSMNGRSTTPERSTNGRSSPRGIALISVQPEERQNGHDHDDEADKIDQSVHDTSLTNAQE